MAITRVQTAAGNSVNAPTVVTLGASPTNGNSLIAVIGTTGAAINEVSGISQTGATWTRVVQTANSGAELEMWKAESVSGAGTGITVSYIGNVTALVRVIEYSGLVSSGIDDQTATNTGSNNSPDSGTTGTLSQAVEVCVAAFCHIPLGPGSHPITGLTNSYTLIADDGPVGVTHLATAEFFTSGTGAQNTTGSYTAALPLTNTWSGAIVTLKGTGAPPENDGFWNFFG